MGLVTKFQNVNEIGEKEKFIDLQVEVLASFCEPGQNLVKLCGDGPLAVLCCLCGHHCVQVIVYFVLIDVGFTLECRNDCSTKFDQIILATVLTR